MRIIRLLAVCFFAVGIVLSATGVACSGSAGPRPPSTFAPVIITPIPVDIADTTATPPEIAATAAPAPFDGQVTRLKIPKFKVDSSIEPLGLRPGINELDVPKNPHNTAWYNIYEKPGFGGNAVFSAHVDYYPDIKGPFYNLAKIGTGDEVMVVMENGLEYRYRVISKQRYRVDEIPMGEIIDAPQKPDGKEWVTLITCGGEFRAFNGTSGPGEYLNRDVVVAERIS